MLFTSLIHALESHDNAIFLYIPPGHRDRNCYRRKRYHDPQLDYYLNLIRITYSAADEVAQGKKKKHPKSLYLVKICKRAVILSERLL